MNSMIARISPLKLDEVRGAFVSPGMRGMLASDNEASGSRSDYAENRSRANLAVKCVPRIKLDSVSPDSITEGVAVAISSTDRTGWIVDGNAVAPAIREVQGEIRACPDERDENAL